MRYEAIVAAALAGTTTAHSIPGGAPQMLGGRKALASLKALGATAKRAAPVPAPAPVHGPLRRNLETRQNPTRCGEGVGNCAAADCCSPAGWCGVGPEYCSAPDCQQNFGPACDANQKPPGVDTSGADRTHVGSVSYNGAGIYDCAVTGDIAITFDDGPYSYTNDLLDILDAYNAKATFFITGNNLGKGMINDESTGYPTIVRRMHNSGHQIASHTWSHQNASETTAQQWTDQMVWNEIAINDILGFFPTYMRPPYSICPAQCQSILSDLGYHITYFDLDTDGYNNNDINQIQDSKDILDSALASSSPSSDSWLHIEHDIQDVVVYNFMEYMLQQLVADGWNMVTVGECLGDPAANWYRTAGTTGGGGDGELTVSTDGTCGNGVTCLGSEFGNCCSPHSWCGSTEDHCSSECQPDFGDCSTTGTPTETATSSADPTPTATDSVSVDGACGNGVTCLGSSFGDCCSQYGWCGSSTAHCDAGCQPGSGSCTGTGGGGGVVLTPSTDGTCGDGVTCLGSGLGDCCSQYGWCGSTTGHCEAGCQADFGTCSTSGLSSSSSTSSVSSPPTGTNSQPISSSSSSVSTSTSTDVSSPAAASTTASSTPTTTSKPTPTSTELVSSTNGQCGPAAGTTCEDYYFGILPCCSSDNRCGLFACWSSGCQDDYGKCF